jgi:hypothetical protein
MIGSKEKPPKEYNAFVASMPSLVGITAASVLAPSIARHLIGMMGMPEWLYHLGDSTRVV